MGIKNRVSKLDLDNVLSKSTVSIGFLRRVVCYEMDIYLYIGKINLVKFNFLECERFHSFYHLYEDDLNLKLADIKEIHLIEKKKVDKV